MTYLQNRESDTRARLDGRRQLWLSTRQTNGTWTNWYMSSISPKVDSATYHELRKTWLDVSQVRY